MCDEKVSHKVRIFFIIDTPLRISAFVRSSSSNHRHKLCKIYNINVCSGCEGNKNQKTHEIPSNTRNFHVISLERVRNRKRTALSTKIEAASLIFSVKVYYLHMKLINQLINNLICIVCVLRYFIYIIFVLLFN